MKILLCIPIAATLLCGCNHKQKVIAWEDQTPQQHLEHWRSIDESIMLKECTNSLVGFSRVTEAYVDDLSANLKDWQGHVTADYVNHFGGIDRTNLWYRFRSDAGELRAFDDYELRIKTDQQTMEAHWKQIANGEK